jgi:ankyrin repeat protein
MSSQKPTQSPLIAAIRSGRISSIDAALDNGMDIEEPDMHGSRGLPLRTACFIGDLAVVRHLLQRGADVNAPAHDGPGAPLRLASRQGHKQVVALLLQHGAQIPEGLRIEAETLTNISSEPLADKADGPLVPLSPSSDDFSLSLPELDIEPQVVEEPEIHTDDEVGNETRLIGLDLLFLDESPLLPTASGSETTLPSAEDESASGFWKTGKRLTNQ